MLHHTTSIMQQVSYRACATPTQLLPPQYYCYYFHYHENYHHYHYYLYCFQA